jgi:cytochrome c553
MIGLLAQVASIAALLAAIWSGPVAGQNAAKPETAKGQTIASQVCIACHAADGNSTLPVNPKLAGQNYDYLYKQLVNFKPEAGKKADRDNAVMAGMIANLSGADMRDVAAYFAAQKLKPSSARDKELAALGQKLYRGGNTASGVAACAGCHGPSGAGMPALYPRISGQFAEYIEAQLKAFRAGTRANDFNGMMRTVAARMSDREIQAVSEYAAGLR